MDPRWPLALMLALFIACTRAEPGPAAPGLPTTGVTTGGSPPITTAAVPSGENARDMAPPELAPVAAVYPWGPAATDRLDARFPAPEGFTRSDTPRGSFAEFLRTLPLLPEGAPVVDFRGRRLHDDGHHPNIAAVVDIDVGSKDLQQCADAIIRLEAEWRYGKGERNLSYHAVSGQALSYRSWALGERSVVSGTSLVFRRVAPPARDDHALFRGWLDDVFAWAGTASLEREGTRVASPADVVAGDFFVMSASPFGHAVLVLDVAHDAKDPRRVALLLGQSYMPAQSFQVLRPSSPRGASAWFIVEPGQATVDTPFWRPFPMSSLRRFASTPTRTQVPVEEQR